MKIKKVAGILLAGTMMISMAACGGKEEGAKSEKLIVGTEASRKSTPNLSFDSFRKTQRFFLESNEKDAQAAKAIADEMGKELEIKNMDFDGALAAVQSGKVDFVAAGVSISPEREEAMDFSNEYVNSTEVIVVNKENPAVTPAGEELAGSDLDGKVVAVQQGNIADIWVSNKDNCNPKEVKRYTKFAQAAEDLKNGKIDCIVMDQYPAEELVAANDTLTTLDGTLFEDKYAIAVKKGNKELLDEINKVIDKLVEEGKIEEFTANHVQSE